jgi:hypothetical protein
MDAEWVESPNTIALFPVKFWQSIDFENHDEFEINFVCEYI